MDTLIEQNVAIFFPVFFAMFWLGITTFLAFVSGWFRLMEHFPNKAENPILRIGWQSGSMGPGVSMNGILNLGVCASGLRVGISRLFGPFCRDLFIPWQDIRVTRSTLLLWPMAKLQFGGPTVGSLTLPAHVANRLARAAAGRWPEQGIIPEQTRRDTGRRLLIQWAVPTGLAALFFTLVPLALAPTAGWPPIGVAILFPAIVFGVATIARYFIERG